MKRLMIVFVACGSLVLSANPASAQWDIMGRALSQYGNSALRGMSQAREQADRDEEIRQDREQRQYEEYRRRIEETNRLNRENDQRRYERWRDQEILRAIREHR